MLRGRRRDKMDTKHGLKLLTILAFLSLFALTSCAKPSQAPNEQPTETLEDALKKLTSHIKAPTTRKPKPEPAPTPAATHGTSTHNTPKEPSTTSTNNESTSKDSKPDPSRGDSQPTEHTKPSGHESSSDQDSSKHGASGPDHKRKGNGDSGPLVSVTRSMDERGVMKFVFHQGGKPCLKAKFKLAVLVTYPSRGKNKTTVPLTANLLPPRDVIIGGQCWLGNKTRPRIELEWGGGNYRLVFHFSTAMVKAKSTFEGSDDDDSSADYLEPVSQAESISFTYNMGDSNVFLHPVKAGILTAHSDKDSSLFQTPVNGSYRCSSPSQIPLHLNDREDEVVLKMSDARIQTYNLNSDAKFSEETVCEPDRVSPSKNIIPIAIAGALTAVIVIVVLAYFISRRTARPGYTAMAE